MKRLAGALLMVAACNDSKGPPPMPAGSAAPPSPSSVAELAVDGGLEVADPPPPAGDLKQELDHFVNVETCVQEKAKLDPLVGDALRAIGYDTFLRDACRLLEAAKDRSE